MAHAYDARGDVRAQAWDLRPRIDGSVRIPYHSTEEANLRSITETALSAAGVPRQHVAWTPGSTTCLPSHIPSAYARDTLPTMLGGSIPDEEWLESNDDFGYAVAGRRTLMGDTGDTHRSPPRPRAPSVGALLVSAGEAGDAPPIALMGAISLADSAEEEGPEQVVAEAAAALRRAERGVRQLREAMVLAQGRAAAAAAHLARDRGPPPPLPTYPQDEGERGPTAAGLGATGDSEGGALQAVPTERKSVG